MIRNFYWICLLLLSMGSPVFAKTATAKAADVTAMLPSKSGKGTMTVPAPSPASNTVTKAQPPAPKKSVAAAEPTRTPARGSVSPSLAAKQQASAPSPFHAESRAASSTPVIRGNIICTAGSIPVRTSSGSALMFNSDNDRGESGGRLARVTAYWAGEGDYYTGRCMSATGVRLHDGHCAVDPNIIPYGSVVTISGVGRFLAVDTGSAVISRTAAREGGHTDAERHAIVVDVFFEDRSQGERFAAGDAKYVSISWYTPTAMNEQAKTARSSFADENWVKIENKQM